MHSPFFFFFFLLRLIAIRVETEGNWSLLLHFFEARVIARNCCETAACNVVWEEQVSRTRERIQGEHVEDLLLLINISF